MPHFQLFRVLVVEPLQRNLFGDAFDRRAILEDAIKSRPTLEMKQGKQWMMSEPSVVDSDTWYFQIGRKTKTQIPRYDEKERSFFNQEDGDATPFTNVLFDLKYQVVAISPKAILSGETKNLGRFFEGMLNQSSVIRKIQAKVIVAPLKDPASFIEELESAFRVTELTFTAGLPNPPGEPKIKSSLKAFTREIQGTRAKVIVNGNDLNRDLAVTISKSVAASGDDVTAKIIKTESDLPTNRRMSDEEVVVDVHSLADIASKSEAADLIRERSKSIGLTLKPEEEIPLPVQQFYLSGASPEAGLELPMLPADVVGGSKAIEGNRKEDKGNPESAG